MGSVIWNENKNAIVDYMQPYLGQKLADCTLYSQDGFEFPIHKVHYNFESMNFGQMLLPLINPNWHETGRIYLLIIFESGFVS